MEDITQTTSALIGNRDRPHNHKMDGNEFVIKTANGPLNPSTTGSSEFVELAGEDDDSCLRCKSSGKSAIILTCGPRATIGKAPESLKLRVSMSSTIRINHTDANSLIRHGIPETSGITACESTTKIFDQQPAQLSGAGECDGKGPYCFDGNERSKLMLAAQAADLPSDDSFSDASDFDCESPRAAKLIVMPPPIVKHESENSGNVRPLLAKHVPENDDLESEDGTILLSEDTDTQSTSNDDDESESDHEVQPWKRTSNSEKMGQTKANKKGMKSASFTGSLRLANFKWPSFGARIFHSFRTIKEGTASSGDGGRSISVKNLPGEVTDDVLCNFFQDAGSISAVRITRGTLAGQSSGLGSALIEFKTVAAAMRAVQKNGKVLGGRVISCDFHTKYAGKQRSVGFTTGDGGKTYQHKVSRANQPSVSPTPRALRGHSSIKAFNPKLHEGDAKFLSCFKDQRKGNSCGLGTSPRLNDNLDEENGHDHGHSLVQDTRAREGDKETPIQQEHLPESYDRGFLRTSKTREDLEQSISYDAKLELQDPLNQGKMCAVWPWRWRRNSKGYWMPVFWTSKIPRWHLWQFAKATNTCVPRKSGRKVITGRPDKSRARKAFTDESEDQVLEIKKYGS